MLSGEVPYMVWAKKRAYVAYIRILGVLNEFDIIGKIYKHDIEYNLLELMNCKI